MQKAERSADRPVLVVNVAVQMPLIGLGIQLAGGVIVALLPGKQLQAFRQRRRRKRTKRGEVQFHEEAAEEPEPRAPEDVLMQPVPMQQQLRLNPVNPGRMLEQFEQMAEELLGHPGRNMRKGKDVPDNGLVVFINTKGISGNPAVRSEE